jgi:hypothetical protein
MASPYLTQAVKNFLNSPEIEAFREAWHHTDLVQSAQDDAWWDSFTMDERAKAFRQICKLIYKADVKDRGSYRHTVYDIFNIDYGDGLKHYMHLHNLIHQGLEAEQKPREGSGIDERNDNTCDLP